MRKCNLCVNEEFVMTMLNDHVECKECCICRAPTIGNECARMFGDDFCGESVGALFHTYLSLRSRFFCVYVLVDCVFMISKRNLDSGPMSRIPLKK